MTSTPDAEAGPPTVWVVGPMSSGNRVFNDILIDGGIDTRFDHSHGTTDLDLDGCVVIVVERDLAATRCSWEAGWKGHPDAVDLDRSLAEIPARYPHAPRVSYEQLCADPDGVIAEIAVLLGVAPWHCRFELVCQNDKWAHGGGKQLGPGAPYNAIDPERWAKPAGKDTTP